MSKLAFTAMTLVGAAPAGFTLFLFVPRFMDRGVPEMNLLGIMVCVTMAMLFLVVVTPLIVLVRYTAPASPDAASAKGDGKPEDSKKAAAKGKADEGFGDAIPDVDMDELNASNATDDDDFETEETGDDFNYEDDMEDFEEEEEEKPKAKGKAKKK